MKTHQPRELYRHWPDDETESGIANVDASVRRWRERRITSRDIVREVGAWCLVALVIGACWGGLVAFLHFLNK
jgi:hypothetical protein